jgi:hypothetical protein
LEDLASLLSETIPGLITIPYSSVMLDIAHCVRHIYPNIYDISEVSSALPSTENLFSLHTHAFLMSLFSKLLEKIEIQPGTFSVVFFNADYLEPSLFAFDQSTDTENIKQLENTLGYNRNNSLGAQATLVRQRTGTHTSTHTVGLHHTIDIDRYNYTVSNKPQLQTFRKSRIIVTENSLARYML